MNSVKHGYGKTWVLFICLCLPFAVKAVFIEVGCEARTFRQEIMLIGSELDVNFWMPLEKDCQGACLTIVVHFLGKAFHDGNKIISFFPQYVTINETPTDEETPKNISLKPPLSPGMTNIKLDFGTDIRMYRGNETLHLDKWDDLQVEKVTVHGSNTTFNCLSNKTAWSVNGSRETIPLSGVGSHHLTIYSKGEVKPSLSIGGHNFNLDSKALTPHREHDIILECTDSTSQDTNCTLLVGNTKSESFPCQNGLCYLTMSGSATQPFMVILKKSVQEKNEVSDNTMVLLFISILPMILTIAFLFKSFDDLRCATILGGCKKQKQV